MTSITPEPEEHPMSDYMFMLESHLSADQNRVVEQVQAAAGTAGPQPLP
ncbi:MAG: hypothetical protein U0Q18_06045 [Bryobacteraceae bacterium]